MLFKIKGVKRAFSIIVATVMLLSMLPTLHVFAAPSIGSKFSIFSYPKHASNAANGRSYIWALSPDAGYTGSGDYIRAEHFIAGDGIIHEPTAGSLNGFNTKVTVRHRAGLTKWDGKWTSPLNPKGTFVSRDSDLAAVVTYAEDGVTKKSPAFRFTGFHFNAKQGMDFGKENTITEFDLGVYPNVVNVNIYHILSEPVDGSAHDVPAMTYSTPYHERVDFTVVSAAGAAELPPETKYYIEKNVLPNADKGVPMATPVPAAQTPAEAWDFPEPLVTPGPIVTNSAVVPYGLGVMFTLFSSDNKANYNGDPIEPPAGSNVIEDAAPVKNKGNGVTRWEFGMGGKAYWRGYNGASFASSEGSTGSKVTYMPKEGVLKDVKTEIKAFQFCQWSGPIDAVIRHGNGQETTINYLPANYKPPKAHPQASSSSAAYITVGEFWDLESVTLCPKTTNGTPMPDLVFKVINEKPGTEDPALPSREYEKPDIATVTPPPVPREPAPDVTGTMLYINEVCSNNNSYPDYYGEFSDWLEIYNDSDSAQSLGGFYLTDSVNNLKKRMLPESAVVPAKGFLTVIASKKDVVTANGEIHVNLAFSKDGESISLVNPLGERVDVANLPTLKSDTTYSRVPDGTGVFKITSATKGESNNSAEIIASVVPRPVFSHESGFYKDAFDLSLSSPGGTVFYTLDGSTPSENNTLGQTTMLKYSGDKITINTNIPVKNATLILTKYSGGVLSNIKKISGVNVIANTIGEVTVPGDFKAGQGDLIKIYLWDDINSIIPLATFMGEGGAGAVLVDGVSQNYVSPLRIKNRTSEPNGISAAAYLTSETPPSALVDKATIVRAVVMDSEGNYSDVVTKTYFVGLDMQKDYNNTMIISLATDVEDLLDNEDYRNNVDTTQSAFKFDTGKGLFPNFQEQHKEFEKKVHLDIFDKDGSLAVSQTAGTRTRSYGFKGMAQKGLNLHARGEYGESRFNYPLFENSFSQVDGSLISEYKSVALRHGSINYDRDRFRDGFGQKLAGDAGVGFQAQRPVILFVNGEYWGIYYMSERAEDDYIEAHYGIPKDDVILIKNHFNKGEASLADKKLYETDNGALDTSKTNTSRPDNSTGFSSKTNYEWFTARYDIDNFMLYHAANYLLSNRDWQAYNFVQWRSRYITDKPYEDGKWRYLTYDMDTTYYEMPIDVYMKTTWAPLTNETLKKMFMQYCSDTYFNVYAQNKAYEEFLYWYDEAMQIFEPKMKERWGGSWYLYNANVSAFGMAGYDRVGDIARHLGLKGKLAYLNVHVNDNTMGTVRVNSITPDFSLGSYSTKNYTDYTSDLTAIPNPGYSFAGWTYTDGTGLSSDTGLTTHVTLALNGSRVTANFIPVPEYTQNISTPQELLEAANMINSDSYYANGTYTLTRDLVFTGENNFTAMGTKAVSFTGTFDGGYHTITGINIAASSQGQGLFGYVGETGVVKNLGATNIKIDSSDKNAGGIAGRNLGLIENCYTTGSIKGASTAGGIAGNNTGGANGSGIVKNCYSTATIISNGKTEGGIAGKTEYGARIINCYSLIAPVLKTNDDVAGSDGYVDGLTSAKTAEQFKNGTVTLLLNENGNDIWANGTLSPVFK